MLGQQTITDEQRKRAIQIRAEQKIKYRGGDIVSYWSSLRAHWVAEFTHPDFEHPKIFPKSQWRLDYVTSDCRGIALAMAKAEVDKLLAMITAPAR